MDTMRTKDLRILGIFAKNKLLGIKSPIHVSFQTTTACNLECAYCYADARKPRDNELDTQEAKALLMDLKKMGIFILVFTGGEPLLRNDLDDLVAFCAKIKLYSGVATNGILLTKDKANRLKDLGLNRFLFSLDGSCEEIHSRLRGRNTFEKTLKGIENAVSTGLHVSVQTTVTKYNQYDLENIATLLESIKTQILRLQLVVPCGRGSDIFDAERFSSEEILDLMERVYILIDKYKNRLRIEFHDLQLFKAFLYKKAKHNFKEKFMLWLRGSCGVLEGAVIYVNSDGSIRSCPHFPYVLPEVNVRKQSIIDIYHANPILQKLRNKKNLRGICRDCKYLFCCGGCRAQIFAETGDFFGSNNSCPLFEKIATG